MTKAPLAHLNHGVDMITEATSTDSPRIVVGLDGSENSLAALRWAIEEAVLIHAPVEVVHCWEARDLTDVVFASRHELSTASVCMLGTQVAAALRDLAECPEVSTASLHGRPADALVERSRSARMIVLGAQQRPALRDVLRGGVIQTVQRDASCPVVVVDRHDADRINAAARVSSSV
jgi:nucleotide-binding universal stress UspA family protein